MKNELLCGNCGVPQEIHGSTCCGWMNASPVIFPWEKTIAATMTDEEKKLRWERKNWTQEQWNESTPSPSRGFTEGQLRCAFEEGRNSFSYEVGGEFDEDEKPFKSFKEFLASLPLQSKVEGDEGKN